MTDLFDLLDTIYSYNREYPYHNIYYDMSIVRGLILRSIITCDLLDGTFVDRLRIPMNVSRLTVLPISIPRHAIIALLYPEGRYFLYDSSCQTPINILKDIDKDMTASGYSLIESSECYIQRCTGDNYCSFWSILFAYLVCNTGLGPNSVLESLQSLDISLKKTLIKRFMTMIYETVYLENDMEIHSIERGRIIIDSNINNSMTIELLSSLSYSQDEDRYRKDRRIPYLSKSIYLNIDTYELVVDMSYENHDIDILLSISSLRDIDILYYNINAFYLYRTLFNYIDMESLLLKYMETMSIIVSKHKDTIEELERSLEPYVESLLSFIYRNVRYTKGLNRLMTDFLIYPSIYYYRNCESLYPKEVERYFSNIGSNEYLGIYLGNPVWTSMPIFTGNDIKETILLSSPIPIDKNIERRLDHMIESYL